MAGVSYQVRVRDSEDSLSFWALGGRALGLGLFLLHPRYHLARSEVSQLRRLYDGLSAVGRVAELAFRRFDLAFGRDLPEDRLVDFWVALESLFAKQGEAQELTYKFAMRIAHFVGTSPEERVALFGRLQDAYSVRSKVVHGTRSRRATREVIREAEETTESALRAALSRVAVGGTAPRPEELDVMAVRGSREEA